MQNARTSSGVHAASVRCSQSKTVEQLARHNIETGRCYDGEAPLIGVFKWLLWNDPGVYSVAQLRWPVATRVGFPSGLEEYFFRS